MVMTSGWPLGYSDVHGVAWNPGIVCSALWHSQLTTTQCTPVKLILKGHCTVIIFEITDTISLLCYFIYRKYKFAQLESSAIPQIMTANKISCYSIMRIQNIQNPNSYDEKLCKNSIHHQKKKTYQNNV